MIKVYKSGEEAVKENLALIESDVFEGIFFKLDAPLLTIVNKKDYCIKVSSDSRELLCMRVASYNLFFCGDGSLIDELVDYLHVENYFIPGLIGRSEIVERFIKISNEKYGESYKPLLLMDYMKAIAFTGDSSSEVEPALDSDVDEIYECMKQFIIDCNLDDVIEKESIRKGISFFRVIRKDGQVAAVAKYWEASPFSYHIANVFTRHDYRNQGLAKKVVNAIKNEIFAKGKYATLNVDQVNPISNHVYRSLGFEKQYSRAEYRKI